jgi:hypothetical protein
MDPGVTGNEGPRIRPAPFRHSGLVRSWLRPPGSGPIPSSRNRPEPAPDPIRGIHVHRHETAQASPQITKAAVTSSIEPDTTVAGGNADIR